MILAEMPTHSAFALTVVGLYRSPPSAGRHLEELIFNWSGAAYETGGEQFSNEMLVEKRIYLVRFVFFLLPPLFFADLAPIQKF